MQDVSGYLECRWESCAHLSERGVRGIRATLSGDGGVETAVACELFLRYGPHRIGGEACSVLLRTNLGQTSRCGRRRICRYDPVSTTRYQVKKTCFLFVGVDDDEGWCALVVVERALGVVEVVVEGKTGMR